MARVAIEKSSIPLNDSVVLPTLVALTSATDGAEITFDKADNKIVVLVKNAHADTAQTVTIKQGNGIQGVEDFTKSIPFGETHAFVIESGKFVNVSGTDKGKVVLVGSTTDIQVGAVVLP